MNLEQETMRRVSMRILPFVFVLYIFNFLDRSNVGLAGRYALPVIRGIL